MIKFKKELFFIFLLILCVNSAYAVDDNTTNSYLINETVTDNSHELTTNIEVNNDYNYEITKATTTVSAPKVTNTYQKNQYFKTTVKHKITGLTLPDINLNLKVYTGTDYKIYSVTTNADGVASFNTKNLSVGTHKVVIESANSKYTISTTSSITIKK